MLADIGRNAMWAWIAFFAMLGVSDLFWYLDRKSKRKPKDEEDKG